MPSTPAVAPDPHPARRGRARAILAGSVPNLVQWFNLYVYAIFAPYFRTEFFDSESRDSLIYVYAL
ncbi:hypothetical protein ACMWQA_27270, partial [Escherichia coli]